MKFILFFLHLFLVLSVMAGEIVLNDQLKNYIDEQIQEKTSKINKKWRFGGRVYFDSVFYSKNKVLEDKIGKMTDGTEFRTLRFFSAGDISENIYLKTQVDFANGVTSLKDTYFQIKDFLKGYLVIGHFKEPWGFENLISSKHITFMEPPITDIFSPNRNTGIMYERQAYKSKGNIFVGMFRNTNDNGAIQSADGTGIAIRSTLKVIENKEKDLLVHFGGAYNYKKSDTGVFRLRTRAESHLGPYFIDTGNFDANHADLANVELSVQKGSSIISCEWVNSWYGDTLQRRKFDGYYFEISHFLTGEKKPYNSNLGSYRGIKPKTEFSSKNRFGGAVELAGRYSYLNMNSGDTNAGRMSSLNVGLNWYLDNKTRFMIDYVMPTLKGVDKGEIIQFRLQSDFE